MKKGLKILIVSLVIVSVAIISITFINSNRKNEFEKGFSEKDRDMYINSEKIEENFSKKNAPREIQIQELTEEEISEIDKFFSSSPNSEEIDNYCKENFSYCIYYCMNEDSDLEYCQKIPPEENRDLTIKN